ncbi:MAG: DNA mismatch repair protein MutS [Rhodobacteraceae bacterium]|nr:MAG: DNA mismatch repair protein MutS [Paracoccaceae bacterium]
MTRRRLTPDEIDLWHRVVESTERLHPMPKTAQPRPMTMPKPKPVKSPLPRLDGFTLGQTAPGKPRRHDLKPALVDHLLAAPIQMDRKAFGRMKRGKLRPEGRLDLHGMTMNRAQPALVRFILSAQASGKRLVLVITGKGKPSDTSGPIPVPHGVLRHQVPHWLSTPPLAQAVLQISPAHNSHGGGGALYVYLRRGR